jgi:hypothetical protein
MNDPNELSVFLDFYDGEDMQTVWCWKNDATAEASQEFSSEKEALAAWRNDELIWSHLSDLGE